MLYDGMLMRYLMVDADSFYGEDARTDYTFDEVFAVIRLAHKYNIEDVEKQALFALREYTFNDDFEKWEEDREERIKVEGPCAIGAVNLARLLEQPEMLVIALYKCLGLGSNMLDGWKRSDGSIEHLSQEDVKRCIAANIRLSRSSAIVAYEIFCAKPSNKCKQKSRCEDSLRRMLVDFLLIHGHEISTGSMAISPWTGAFEGLDELGLCEECWSEMEDREVAGRRGVWSRFPEIFGVKTKSWGSSVCDQC